MIHENYVFITFRICKKYIKGSYPVNHHACLSSVYLFYSIKQGLIVFRVGIFYDFEDVRLCLFHE